MNLHEVLQNLDGAADASPDPVHRAKARQRVLTRAADTSSGRTQFRGARLRLATAGLVLAAVAGGAGGYAAFHSPDDAVQAADGPTPVAGSRMFDLDTTSDIATWADQVVVAVPKSEREVWGDSKVTDDGSGDGLVSRALTFDVEETLWTREGGEQVGDSFDALAWGWVLIDGKKSPVELVGEPDFQVGQRYVMTLTWNDGEWLALGPASYLLADGKVAPVEDQKSQYSLALSGKSIEDLRSFLPEALGPEHAYPELAERLALPLQQRLRAYGQALASKDETEPEPRHEHSHESD